jgi:hypothetical protein
MFELIKPILEESHQRKKGITFYINGTTVVGYVTKIIGDKAVEAKNQRNSKVLIAIDRIDALEIA